jgi:hypothetical protein
MASAYADARIENPAERESRMSRWLAVGLVLFVAFGVVTNACGGGGGDKNDATKAPTSASTVKTGTPPGDETPEPTTGGTQASGRSDLVAIENVVGAQTDANNNKDVDAFVAAFSDSYYADLGVSRDDARALVTTFIGIPHVDITNISAVQVSGDNATAQVDSNEGVFLSREKYSFVRETGQWKIAKIEELPVDADTSNAVGLSLVEYNFVFDENAAKDGDVVFSVSNTGAQRHEIELMKLPSGVTAEQLKDRENVPAGVEAIGLFGPLDPGEKRTLAFATKLDVGHYALVCYLSDPSGQSYASFGMVEDLVVS